MEKGQPAPGSRGNKPSVTPGCKSLGTQPVAPGVHRTALFLSLGGSFQGTRIGFPGFPGGCIEGTVALTSLEKALSLLELSVAVTAK